MAVTSEWMIDQTDIEKSAICQLPRFTKTGHDEEIENENIINQPSQIDRPSLTACWKQGACGTCSRA